MSKLNVWAHLGLNKTGFDAGMDSAGKKVSKFGGDLKSGLAGAFGAAAVLSFVRSTIDAAEAVGDLRDRLGTTTENAQDFALAAKLGGMDVDGFAVKMEKLRTFMAGGGSLKEFGIETRDSAEALKELAGIISSTGLTAEQSVKFVEIFGKGSGKLITALGDLEMAKKAIKFSDDDTNNAQAMSDTWGVIVSSAQALLAKSASMSLFGIGAKILRGSKPERIATDVSGAEAKVAEKEARQKAILEDAAGHMAIQDRILKMESETAAISERTRIAKLTDEERLTEMKMEQLELQKKLAIEVPVDAEGVTFREKYYEMQKRLAELGLEIQTGTKKGVSAIASDQFGRIGAFTGAAAGAGQSDLARRQLTALEALRADLTSRGILIRGTD